MASAQAMPTNLDAEKCAASIRSINNNNDTNSNDDGSGKLYASGTEAVREVLSLHEMDPATTKKMHLINNVSKRMKTTIKWKILTYPYRLWTKLAGQDTTGNYSPLAASGKHSFHRNHLPVQASKPNVFTDIQ